MAGHARFDPALIALLEDQVSKPDVDKPPEDFGGQPCELVQAYKVGKLVPI